MSPGIRASLTYSMSSTDDSSGNPDVNIWREREGERCIHVYSSRRGRGEGEGEKKKTNKEKEEMRKRKRRKGEKGGRERGGGY